MVERNPRLVPVVRKGTIEMSFDKHYEKLYELRDNPTTPYWLADLIDVIGNKDPVDVWVGLRAVLSIYDEQIAEIQEIGEDMGLDS